MRMQLGVAGAALVAMAAAGQASAQDRVVNLYNWSDYIDESILSDFTAETGIRVVSNYYDNNEIVETTLLAGGSGYDIVVPTDRNIQRLIATGVLQPLDTTLIPNLQYLWPAITERLETYDPGNAYAVPYMWGTTGLGYNAAMIAERLPDAPVDSMDLLFDPEVVSKFADCGVYILDSPDDVLPAALNYLGLDPDSKDEAEIQQAADVLMAIRPYVTKFHSSEFIEALANGDACLAFGYSGDILQARDRADEAGNGIEIVYSIPEEGALLWVDAMVIPADAPNVAEAHALIDFIMRPGMIARATNYVSYPNGNLASQEFVDPEILADPTVYPPEEIVNNLYTTTPNDARTQRFMTRVWTTIRTGL